MPKSDIGFGAAYKAGSAGSLSARMAQPHIFHNYEDGSYLIRETPPRSVGTMSNSPVLPKGFNAKHYLELNLDIETAGVDAAVHFVY